MQKTNAYGLWVLVIFNSAIFIIFAFSFYKPKTNRDWRSLGAFSAFIVALFTEMYGFPLTIYLLSGWLETKFPQVNIFSHDAGHLWHTIFGLKGNAHFDIFHIISMLIIFAGFYMLVVAWPVLFKAQKAHQLAKTKIYSKIRHPQYVAFIVIMLGFLFQWPTLITLIMFPILVWFYIRLAKHEEKAALKEFGEEYENYMKVTPGFIPQFYEKDKEGSRL